MDLSLKQPPQRSLSDPASHPYKGVLDIIQKSHASEGDSGDEEVLDLSIKIPSTKRCETLIGNHTDSHPTTRTSLNSDLSDDVFSPKSKVAYTLPPLHPSLFGVTHHLVTKSGCTLAKNSENSIVGKTLNNVIETLGRVRSNQLNALEKNCQPHSVHPFLKDQTQPDCFSEDDSLYGVEKINPKILMCAICGKLTSSQTAFHRHMRSHRQRSFHPCEYCGKDFRDRCTLLTHVRTHTGEKPYTCQTCGAKFRQSGTLRRHTKIHTGDKPYKCEMCGKQFRHSSTLIIHKRIHTGENPHQCLICLKRFRQSGHLQKHIATHELPTESRCSTANKFHSPCKD